MLLLLLSICTFFSCKEIVSVKLREKEWFQLKFERSMELLERIIPNILYLYINFIKSLASSLNAQVNLPFPLHQSIDHIGDISHNSNIPMR